MLRTQIKYLQIAAERLVGWGGSVQLAVNPAKCQAIIFTGRYSRHDTDQTIQMRTGPNVAKIGEISRCHVRQKTKLHATRTRDSRAYARYDKQTDTNTDEQRSDGKDDDSHVPCLCCSGGHVRMLLLAAHGQLPRQTQTNRRAEQSFYSSGLLIARPPLFVPLQISRDRLGIPHSQNYFFKIAYDEAYRTRHSTLLQHSFGPYEPLLRRNFKTNVRLPLDILIT